MPRSKQMLTIRIHTKSWNVIFKNIQELFLWETAHFKNILLAIRPGIFNDCEAAACRLSTQIKKCAEEKLNTINLE